MTEKIKVYWDERAKSSRHNLNATTDDVYFRQLESKTLFQVVDKYFNQKSIQLLDLGCGDGYLTQYIARRCPNAKVHGIDFSTEMIQIANKMLSQNPNVNLSFSVADLNDIHQLFEEGSQDCIITTRSLINLENTTAQYQALKNISFLLKKDGLYLGLENFIQTHQNMNQARAVFGLDEIPVRWHNVFFDEPEFIEKVRDWFQELELIDFGSTYFFATRVIYSAMCQLQDQQPDYFHPIHEKSIELEPAGQFCPVRLIKLKK